MYEQAPYNVIERIGEMDRPKFAVTKVREGFEFGHGKISGVAANEEVLELVEQTIYDPRKNRDLLVPIDTDDSGEPIKDDGCGDGRGVLTIFSYDETFHKSLNRPKVFGGSSVMAVACVIGLGEAGDLALNPLFERVIKTLDEKNINFGAHTVQIEIRRDLFDLPRRILHPVIRSEAAILFASDGDEDYRPARFGGSF